MLKSFICPFCRNIVNYDTDWNTPAIICPFCQKASMPPPDIPAGAPINNNTPPPEQIDNQSQYANGNEYANGEYAENNGDYEEYAPADNSGDALYILLVLLGYGCYIFAVIDFCGMFFGYDLTGVPWSPIVAGIIGGVLHKVAGHES